MKRGRDDDKNMGPLFPRLHVNDTEKGGPRAPPRNKMALYEQLTIPSQRFSSGGAVSHKQNNSNSSNSSLVPSTSTSQGTSRERNMYFPLYRPPLMPAYGGSLIHNPEVAGLSNQAHMENKKRPLEEDDFTVPIFSQPLAEPHNGETLNFTDGENRSHFSSNHQNVLPSTINGKTNDGISKQQTKDQDGRNLGVSDALPRKSLDLSMRGEDDVPLGKDSSLPREHQKKQRLSNLDKTGAGLRQGQGDSLPRIDSVYGESVLKLSMENPCKDTSLRLRLNLPAGCGYGGESEINIAIDGKEDDLSPEKDCADRGDDVSETSAVDSALGFDISPDDVVDVIGRKHFWKARTAIVNQQRVLAVQVFELHRLIKVQKLIAESPNLLLEGSAFVSKSSFKDSAVKKFSSEYVKALPHKSVQKDEGRKATDKVEGTAENAVPKAFPLVRFQQGQVPPIDHDSFSANTASSPPVSRDPKMNPLGFHQPAAHQWLVPVMSPSEGLVYKPYPAPGLMGSVCGGCGPAPVMGSMMNPSYGMPNHPPYQHGMGMPPGIPFGGQGYFPAYGMPVVSSSVSGSTVEQHNPFSGPNPYNQMNLPPRDNTNLSVQRQSSLNMPSRENSSHAPAERSFLKGREMQGSTASSPSNRGQGMGMAPSSEGRDMLPLFLAPPTTEVFEDAPPKEKQARVIRVVPHRSTREAAARIFQSIQQERLHYESNSAS